jgi:hypothetical protein
MRALVLGAFFVPVISVAGVALAAPAWIDGKDPRYSSQQYVVGVGKGPDKKAADLDARAEIARVFESNVASVAQDYQAAASTVNGSGKGVSVETQKSSIYTEVTTKKTLSSIELRESAKDGSTHYTLALLDRAQCIASLTEQIETIDSKIEGAIARAEGGDQVASFKAYGSALSMMDEREGLNAMLRVCDRGGKGIPPKLSIGDLAAKFDEAAGSMKIGIDLQGSGAARVKDCLMEQMGNKGYQLVDIEIDDEDEEEAEEDDEEEGGSRGFDLILRGRLKSEKAGEIAGSQMVRTDFVLKLVNPKTKKVLRTVTANRKEGRPSIKASASLSAYKICQKEMPNVVKEIDKIFKR